MKIYLDRRGAGDDGIGGAGRGAGDGGEKAQEPMTNDQTALGHCPLVLGHSSPPPAPRPPSPVPCPPPPAPKRTTGAGTRYLAGRREEINRAAQLRAAVGRELSVVEDRIQRLTAEWRRLRPLSPELTARPESMVWNGALLVSKSQERPLRAACDQLRSDLCRRGSSWS